MLLLSRPLLRPAAQNTEFNEDVERALTPKRKRDLFPLVVQAHDRVRRRRDLLRRRARKPVEQDHLELLPIYHGTLPSRAKATAVPVDDGFPSPAGAGKIPHSLEIHAAAASLMPIAAIDAVGNP